MACRLLLLRGARLLSTVGPRREPVAAPRPDSRCRETDQCEHGECNEGSPQALGTTAGVRRLLTQVSGLKGVNSPLP